MLLCVAAANHSAIAARFPNAIEKKIEFAGPAAIEVGRLLGVAPERRFVSLQLGRGDAWAVYLLRQDTREPLVNDNNGSPARYDVVEFRPDAQAITISPYWLDLGTRAPDPRPGAYSFASPMLTDDAEGYDAWRYILKQFRSEPGWSAGKSVQWHRCYAASSGAQLCFDVYAQTDYSAKPPREGHVIVVTARPKM